MDHILQLDKAVLIWINSHHNPVLDWILGPVSMLGELAALWFAVILVLLIFGKKEDRLTAVTLLLTILVVDQLVLPLFKFAWYRERPYAAIEGIRQWGVRWEGSSFPSGHAHSVWIAAVILSDRWRKLTIPLVAFALLTCYSRPYLGMHYPLDVVVGSLIGVAGGFTALALRHHLRLRSQECEKSDEGMRGR